MNYRDRSAHDTLSSLFETGFSVFVYSYFLMKQLELFSVDNASRPVALVSPNLPEFIKDVIRNNWDKSSSGLGDHYYVNSETITDPDELQEYWEEYSL